MAITVENGKEGGRRRWPLFVSSAILVLFAASSFLLQESGLDMAESRVDSGEEEDEEDLQCVSRSQQHLLRKELGQPKKNMLLSPSPGFSRAWRRYAELHQRCSQNLGHYMAGFAVTGDGSDANSARLGENFSGVNSSGVSSSHVNLSDAKFSGGNLSGAEASEECRFLIFEEGGAGLGNRLLSLTTAFVYALLTNRTILMRPGASIAALLCQPFPNSSWLLPETLLPSVEQALQNSSSLGEFLEGREKKTENSSAAESVVFLNLGHTSREIQFFCDDTQQKLHQRKWLAWHSDQYYLPQLFMIPSFWPSLVALFPDSSHEEAFHWLSLHLILPSNDVWGIVVREYWSYLASSEEILGLQIRLHGHPDRAGFYPEIANRIWDCLLNHSLIPPLVERENPVELLRLSKTKVESTMEKTKGADISVFIASLQIKYTEVLREQYSRAPSFDPKRGRYVATRFHTASHFGRQTGRLDQARLALAEMWLLSLSHRLAASAYSTFGYVAQGFGGTPSLLLHVDKGAPQNPACSVGQSPDPCCHFPKWPACLAPPNLADNHREWLRTHLRHCQDHKVGIQLVDVKANKEEDSNRIGEEILFFNRTKIGEPEILFFKNPR